MKNENFERINDYQKENKVRKTMNLVQNQWEEDNLKRGCMLQRRTPIINWYFPRSNYSQSSLKKLFWKKRKEKKREEKKERENGKDAKKGKRPLFFLPSDIFSFSVMFFPAPSLVDHMLRFSTLKKQKNTQHCENRTSQVGLSNMVRFFFFPSPSKEASDSL